MYRIWAVVLCFLSITSYAQEAAYPVKPIRLLVGYAPGGATDIVARSIALKMQETLGQPVIVENRAGASSNIASEFVAKSAPDGYTLLLGTIANATNMTAYKNMGYDTMRDFKPVSELGSFPLILIVNAKSPGSTSKNCKAFVRAWILRWTSPNRGGHRSEHDAVLNSCQNGQDPWPFCRHFLLNWFRIQMPTTTNQKTKRI